MARFAGPGRSFESPAGVLRARLMSPFGDKCRFPPSWFAEEQLTQNSGSTRYEGANDASAQIDGCRRDRGCSFVHEGACEPRLSNRGDSQWCLVTNKGADSMQWECEYDTSNDCATAVAGTGGYCAINPFWQSDKSSHGRFLAFSRTGARQPNCWTSLDESR